MDFFSERLLTQQTLLATNQSIFSPALATKKWLVARSVMSVLLVHVNAHRLMESIINKPNRYRTYYY